jgi:hypothetical protein
MRQPDVAAARSTQETACYVYGLVPARTRLPGELRGVRGGEVSLVRRGDIAGVVSDVSADEPLGTSEDLLAHERVLASLAQQTTTVPLRFGAVVTGRAAVVEELLAPFHDWFAGVLADLAGRREFVITGTYVEDTVLREVLEEEPEVRRMRERIAGAPADAAYYERIRMGEFIAQALNVKRAEDTEELLRRLAPHAVAGTPNETADDETTAEAAFLVADQDRRRFEDAVDELGARWSGRLRLRMIGPLPPYDFVPALQEEE